MLLMKKTYGMMALSLLLGSGYVCGASSGSVTDGEFAPSPKFNQGNGNPLLDCIYVADPTAVVHNGRVYVYGTNDQQEIDSVGKEVQNGYSHIHSLAMMSTDDMVNWTYHGSIDVGKISPWTGEHGVSWAPSVTSRKEADGKTHFYMYYSQGGCGIGVITATSPVGPWTDPIGRNLIDLQTPGLKECPAPFDPGVVIDDNGIGWLSFGGGRSSTATAFLPGSARIVRLGADMLSLDSDIQEIPAPYFFEASELNYINGTWVYTYSTDWAERTEWPIEDVQAPTACAMGCMTSKSPLDSSSWTYRGDILKNAFEYGLSHSNNHTHFLEFNGDYYIFYHNNHLADYRGIKTGYRNICVDRLDIDRSTLDISTGTMTHKGVSQIKNMNPYDWQQAETVAATYGMKFKATDIPGNMVATGLGCGQRSEVRNVDFGKGVKHFEAKVSGVGVIDLYIDSPEGKRVGSLRLNEDGWNIAKTKLDSKIKGVHDLYFVYRDGTFDFDEWRFR